MSMRKAQIQGQVFIYILILVIAGIIFIFGFNALQAFTKDIETSKLIKFEKDADRIFTKVGTEYGSRETYTFSLPSDYTEICIVDFDELDYDPYFGPLPDEFDSYPIMKSMIENGIRDNIFIYKEIYMKSFNIGKVQTIDCPAQGSEPRNLTCYTLFNGQVNLRIQGIGNVAQVFEEGPDEDCVLALP